MCWELRPNGFLRKSSLVERVGVLDRDDDDGYVFATRQIKRAIHYGLDVKNVVLSDGYA